MEEHLVPPRAIDRFVVKLRHILPTLIYSVVGCTALLMFLRWISIEYHVLELKDEVWGIWIPIILPWIPMTIWLRPKLRIITREKNVDGLITGFQIIAWMAMVVPGVIGQYYVKSATGSLVEINNFEDIRHQPESRYYAIKHFEVDSSWMALGEDIRTSGKYNQDLNFHFYFVQPFVSTSEPFDSSQTVNYWYGVKFDRSISNRDSQSEKERKYGDFYNKSIRDIRFYHFKDVTYFERTLPSEDMNGFLKAVERIGNGLKRKAVILEPVREPFEARAGSKLKWLFGTTIIGIAFFAVSLSFVRYSPQELDNQIKKRKPESDDVVDMFKFLIPRDPHFMTSIILDVNIIVMVVMLFSGVHPMNPNGIELMEWGALKRANVEEGELWRLVSSMFVHAGLAHLVFNIYGLVLASSFLEGELKRTKYAIVYFTSGIVAGIATLFWTDGPGVGASGAIFGLFGAVLGSLLTGYYQKDLRNFIFQLFGPYVVINLLIGFFLPGVGNAAHVGGLLTGIVFGVLFFKKRPESEAEIVNDN